MKNGIYRDSCISDGYYYGIKPGFYYGIYFTLEGKNKTAAKPFRAAAFKSKVWLTERPYQTEKDILPRLLKACTPTSA